MIQSISRQEKKLHNDPDNYCTLQLGLQIRKLEMFGAALSFHI